MINPEEIVEITGPTKSKTIDAVIKKVIIGWKIGRKASGKTFFNQAFSGLAIATATMIGKMV